MSSRDDLSPVPTHGDQLESSLAAYVSSSASIFYSMELSETGARPIWVSKNIENLMGFSLEEVLEQDWWWSHLHPHDRASIAARHQGLLETGALRHEYRFHKKSGEAVWLLDDMRVVRRLPSGGFEVVGTWADISELKHKEAQLQLALDAGQTGLYDIDLDTGHVTFNGQYAQMLGYQPEAFHCDNDDWRQRLHPDDRARASAIFEDYLAGRRPTYRNEFRMRTASGGWKWILSTGTITERHRNGRPRRMLGTHTDISIIKESTNRLEKDRRRTEGMLRVAEAMDDESLVKVLLDAGNALVGGEDAVAALEDPSGRMFQAVRGNRSDLDVVAARRPGGISTRIEQGHDGQVRVTTLSLVIQRFGVDFIASGPDLGKDTVDLEGLQLLGEEVARHASRSHDAAEREADARFREELLNQLGVGVIVCDARGHLTIFNRVAREWHGAPADAQLDPSEWAHRYGLYEWDGLTPLAPDRVPLARALSGELVEDAPIAIRVGDDVRRVRTNAAPILDSAGRRIGALATMHDMTAVAHSESMMRLQRAALEAAANAIVITDRQGTILWANRAFTALSGYSVEEVIDKNPRDLIRSGKETPGLYEGMWRTILAGDTWDGEVINRRKDGSLYPEALTISPVRDEQGVVSHFVAIKRDLTQERALAERMLQAHKLESIGRLAGGVAHDFNNLLTVINGSLDILLDELAPNSHLRGELSEVRQASERAANLTRQLLAFGRQQVLRRDRVHLDEVVRELMRMLERLIGERITVVSQLGSGAEVMVDRGQLEQVIVNLVVNARDAMPNGGTLTITTSVRHIDTTAASELMQSHKRLSQPVPLGNYAVLGVADAGIGMNEEVLEHLFEPFFTTKPVGTGTGLGLPTAYGIVHQSGGFIGVGSRPGDGSTFEVYLPLEVVTPPVKAPTQREERPLVTAARGGTILVVDDEEALRRVTARILTKAGYEVITAGSGAEALALCESRAVELVITDVVMPKMTGSELVALLEERCPGVAVIYTSGYTNDTVVKHGVASEHVRFLAKPYAASVLLDLIRKVFAERQT